MIFFIKHWEVEESCRSIYKEEVAKVVVVICSSMEVMVMEKDEVGVIEMVEVGICGNKVVEVTMRGEEVIYNNNEVEVEVKVKVMMAVPNCKHKVGVSMYRCKSCIWHNSRSHQTYCYSI